MTDFLKYLDEDEEIILSEKDTGNNVFIEILFAITLPLFLLILIFSVYDLFNSVITENIYQKITELLMLPVFAYMIITQIKFFYTKIYLTNKNIVTVVFGKINKYPFEKVSKITVTQGNLLSLRIKNDKKYEIFLSKVNAQIFTERFLSLYPDYQEEKIKKPLLTAICLIYAGVLLFTVTQADIADKKETKQIVSEYSKVIQEDKSWFLSVFSEILRNIEPQKSDVPMKVIVDFRVNENSNLQRMSLVKYSNNQNFDYSCIDAVRKSFPLEAQMPENLKKYAPVKMRINIIHNGTNNEDLRKNYTIWLDIYGPNQAKPYAKMDYKQ